MSPYIIENPPQTPRNPVSTEDVHTPTTPISRPLNPLRAAAHLSLVADPDRLDTSIQSRKEMLIANFATKYTELTSQPSQMSVSTLSSFALTEAGKGTLGRSISNRLIQVAASADLGAASTAEMAQDYGDLAGTNNESIVGKAGQVLKKGFKAFMNRHIHGSEEAGTVHGPQSRLHQREERVQKRGHGRSKSDPTSDSSYTQSAKPESRRRHYTTTTTTSEPQPITPPRQATTPTHIRPALSRSNTNTSTSTTSSHREPQSQQPRPSSQPKPRPGHGIAEAYASLHTRRAAEAEKLRLAEALEAECRAALSGVDGVRMPDDGDDIMIDMRAAWAPCVGVWSEGEGMFDLVEEDDEEEGNLDFVVCK